MNHKKIYCNEEFWTEIAKVWDSDRNEKNWHEYTRGSKKNVWLKCERTNYHESYLIACYNFSGGKRCPLCNRNSGKVHKLDSFAQWGINEICKDFIDKYWDREKNDKLSLNPWQLNTKTHKKVYIKCQKKDYHGSYMISCANFLKGRRCPSCKGIVVHGLDSFAQYHIKNTDGDFLQLYWDYDKNVVSPWEISVYSHQVVHIKCQNIAYHGSYEIWCADFTNNHRCGFCANYQVHPFDSVAVLYPKSLEKWSGKNKTTLFHFKPKSEKFAWWKCENDKHDDYYRKICGEVGADLRCPRCVEELTNSILQTKVNNYLNELGYTILHEHSCTIVPIHPKTKHRMAFDNELLELKLLLEVHGSQHYLANSNWNSFSSKKNNTDPEQELHKVQLYDRYKRIFAKSKGYDYLEIPYWTDDENNTWKKIINNKINEVTTKRL